MMGTYTIMSKCKNEYCDKHFFCYDCYLKFELYRSKRAVNDDDSRKRKPKEQSVIFYFLNDLVKNDTTRLPSLYFVQTLILHCVLFSM